MSRFFKSAAFPILIVVVLAFFAQKLISPGSPQRQNTFADFQTQLANGQIAKATVKTKDNTIDVVLKDKSKYEVGFVDDYGRKLTDQLTAAEQAHKIELRETSLWFVNFEGRMTDSGMGTAPSSSSCRNTFPRKSERSPAWWERWVGSADSFRRCCWAFSATTCTPSGLVSRCLLYCAWFCGAPTRWSS